MIGRLSLLLFVLAIASAAYGKDRSWTDSPYRVQLHLAVDSSRNPGLLDVEQITKDLAQIVRNTLAPMWQLEIVTHNSADAIKLQSHIDSPDNMPQENLDKLMVLTIEATPVAIQLRCREFDCFTKKATPIFERQVRQEMLVAEQSFELLCESFAPLARITVDPQDGGRVSLEFKGASLARNDADLLVAKNTVFEPLLVKFKRGSTSVADQIIAVPWTYLCAEEITDERIWKCIVRSATRQPFGNRRRAGIEMVALALKPVLPSTKVRFYASHNRKLGLANYEVFEKPSANAEYTLLDTTDANGTITVRRSGDPIKMLVLRSDAELLAQIPVVPGAYRELEVPISDDTPRLLVQETLTAFREQLIDIVARRNILIARIRDQLKKGRRDEALKLIDELNNLPTRAKLSQTLDAVERNTNLRSENPRVQAKIERLLADSRSLLSKYLSTREIIELELEVKQSGGEKTAAALNSQ